MENYWILFSLISLKLTGAYLAALDFPEKEIKADNDEEDAHLDKTKAKLLKYIGWSEGSELM